MYFDQSEYEIRCEWGAEGVAQLAPGSDAVVIVDVLSFCTAVDVAVGRGAVVYPFKWRGEAAEEYAESVGALLAGSRWAGGFSLSPSSLMTISAGTRIVLPSPNGSTLTLATGGVPTFAGCLRNAGAVAAAASRMGTRISVIPAGERWEEGTLRPAMEDLLGAGAIIHRLQGDKSPEAEMAEAAFLRFRDGLPQLLRRCSSGKELTGKGFPQDVELASKLDVSDCVPALAQGAYMWWSGPEPDVLAGE